MTKRRDLVRLLEDAGFRSDRGTRHEKFEHDDGRSVYVPRHGEIPYSTARGILKEAGLSNVRSIKR